MQPLNLPAYQIQTRQNGSSVQILDTLRRKFVALTPEEWVRQNFVHYLIEHRNYPASLMANEVSLTLNGMSRRCDTVVYSRENAQPLMVIEYKSPEVAITQKVFNQIMRYNIVMRVNWLVVSNGMQHFCFHINSDGKYETAQGLPDYDNLIKS